MARMPAYDTGLLDGELAWRQHDGGHEDRSNMSFFIAWANRLLHHTPLPVPADRPRVRADRGRHRPRSPAHGRERTFQGPLGSARRPKV